MKSFNLFRFWCVSYWLVRFVFPSMESDINTEESLINSFVIGTGKTETIKGLAKSVAVPFKTFNCFYDIDITVLQHLFIGIAQIGAWLCFDCNFIDNRIVMYFVYKKIFKFLFIKLRLLSYSKGVAFCHCAESLSFQRSKNSAEKET